MDPKLTRRILEQVERPDARSPLFHWLYRHHDELLERAPGGRISWKHACALMAEAGLTDTRGRPPSPALAKLTWQRVRHAVAAARAREATRQAARPSRAAQGAVVVPARTGPAALTVPSRDAAASTNSRPRSADRAPGFDLSAPRLTDEDRRRLQEEQDRLLAQFAKHDARFRLG